MSMKSSTGKNMYDDTSDESTLGTHSSQSEVDDPTKKKRTRNAYSNFQLDELEIPLMLPNILIFMQFIFFRRI